MIKKLMAAAQVWSHIHICFRRKYINYLVACQTYLVLLMTFWVGAGLLQVMDSMSYGNDEIPDNAILQTITFTSKRLSRVEWHYSNIEFEAPRILPGLEKFHLYCFAREVCIITGHKLLVAILIKDVATFSQCLLWIMLPINQCAHHIQAWPRHAYNGLAVQ